MKNVVILIAVSSLLSCFPFVSGNAQENQNHTLNAPRFGVKGGVNFSDLHTKDAEESNWLTGFNLGVFCKLPVSEYFAFQPELYFTTKGAEVTYDNTFVDGTARFVFNYLEVPLLFAVNVNENVNIHVGPYAAFLVSGKATNEANINLFDFEENIDPEDYNKLDAGIAAGVGIDIGAVSLGARYNFGLTRVGKERSFIGTTYVFPDANNGVLNFYISLSLI
jgi:hypothetical protein